MAKDVLNKVDHQVMKVNEDRINVFSRNCFVYFWTDYNSMNFKDESEMIANPFFMTVTFEKIDDIWKISNAHEAWKEFSNDMMDVK